MKRQIAVRRKLALQLYIPANNVSRRLRDGFPGFSVFPSINHKNRDASRKAGIQIGSALSISSERPHIHPLQSF